MSAVSSLGPPVDAHRTHDWILAFTPLLHTFTTISALVSLLVLAFTITTGDLRSPHGVITYATIVSLVMIAVGRGSNIYKSRA